MLFTSTHYLQFVPAPTGYDSGTGDRLRLLDEQTFELMDSFKLEGIEMVCSVACIHLEDEDKEFYAVGSAFLVKEEIEPSKAS